MSDNGVAGSVQRDFQTSMTEHYRSHLDGTNINSKTMLTTDYLNHFSGALMLIEMLPMDPDGLAEDVLEWSPMSYQEHFEVTGFRDKDLAIKAYEHAPYEVRVAFDKVIEQMDEVLVDLLTNVKQSVEARDTEKLSSLCTSVSPVVRELIEKASSIVNDGASNVIEIQAWGNEDDNDSAQDEIDALFD